MSRVVLGSTLFGTTLSATSYAQTDVPPVTPSADPNAADDTRLVRSDKAVEAALASFAARDFRAAQTHFEEALRLEPQRPDRATLLFNQGVCAFELGDDAAARRYFDTAAQESPSLVGEAALSAGFSALRQGDTAAARDYLARVPENDPALQEQRAQLAARLQRLEQPAAAEPTAPPPSPPLQPPDEGASEPPKQPRAMPAPGLIAVVGTVAGYDSNANQSGTVSSIGAGTTTTAIGSPYLSSWVELGYGVGLSPRLQLRPYYAGDALLLTDSSVSALSLQSHRLNTELAWAPSAHWLLRPQLGYSYSLSGLDSPTPFTQEAIGGLRLDWDHSAQWTLRLRGEGRRVWGQGDYHYLTGTRWFAGLAERFYGKSTRFVLEGTVRWIDQGTEIVPIVDASGLPCGTACEGLAYTVPLSYVAPGANVSFGWDLVESLTFDTHASLELRRYLSDSNIAGVSGSQMQRTDLRFGAGAGLQWYLDEEARWSALLDYDWLGSAALTGGRGRNSYDYDQRAFSQHLVEAGLEFRY